MGCVENTQEETTQGTATLWAHLTIGLIMFIALSVSNIVSGGDTGSTKTEGRGGLPPDRESSSPVKKSSTVPQHIPSAGQTNETKAKTSELAASDHNSPAPEKHPSSHAEKHSDYDRMSSETKRPSIRKPLKRRNAD